MSRFYPIFDDVTWLERLVPLGLQWVQLRLKDRSAAEIAVQIAAAKTLCARYECRLVVNDYWQEAIAQGCEWLHLGQEDLDLADRAAIKAAGVKLGISTHDEAELERALALHPDYIALGPIWPTILKQMKWHRQGVEKLDQWRAQIGSIPLVAIGGMTPERAVEAFAHGADLVSAVTDITLNADPEARVRHWLEVCA